MLSLQGETPTSLVKKVGGMTLAEARKVVAAVHRDESLNAPVPQVRRATMDAIRHSGSIPTLEVVTSEHSTLDPFIKFAVRAIDGSIFETVRIPLEREGRFSVCVSSQVGCALGCVFCATGRMGLKRNLETWEIVEQVRIAKRSLPPHARIHGVVFQGMGEPLSNYERVLAAIRVFSEPSALAIDGRAITVTTAGLPTQIRKLAVDAPKVRLGWSIATARKTHRKSLMPIDNAHPIEEVFDAVVEHTKRTGYSPMWALTPLLGKNDSEEDAHALGELFARFVAKTGKRPRVSFIPYNSIGANDPFARLSSEQEDSFRDELRRAGVPTKLRYSGGSDIDAACGQLAARG